MVIMPHPPVDRQICDRERRRTRVVDASHKMLSKPLSEWKVIELADTLVDLEFTQAEISRSSLKKEDFNWMITEFRKELKKR